MPTGNRVVFPDCTLHITNRGNNRMPIFTCALEYRRFLWLLRAAALRFRTNILAFCLMLNHFHLLARFELGDPEKMMSRVQLRYARWFNHRHGRTGHVFQGRYYSRVITDDVYLHEAGRYIHENPVKDGVVAAPEQYEWSSYRAYLAQEGAPPLDLGPLSAPFIAGGRFDAKAFASFTTARQRAVGPSTSPEETIARVAAYFGVKPADLTSHTHRSELAQARGIAMLLLGEVHHLTHSQIAALFGIAHAASVSRSISRTRRACANDPELAEVAARLR